MLKMKNDVSKISATNGDFETKNSNFEFTCPHSKRLDFLDMDPRIFFKYQRHTQVIKSHLQLGFHIFHKFPLATPKKI